MSDLISREEAQKALYGCVMPNQHAEDILAEVPSAEIMECARAIKEYCNQFSECKDCGCLNKSYCAFYTCPDDWNLPEGEKE